MALAAFWAGMFNGDDNNDTDGFRYNAVENKNSIEYSIIVTQLKKIDDVLHTSASRANYMIVVNM